MCRTWRQIGEGDGEEGRTDTFRILMGKPQRRGRFCGKDGKLSKCLLLNCWLSDFSHSERLFVISKTGRWGEAIALLPSLAV